VELEEVTEKYEKTAQRVNMLDKLRAELEAKMDAMAKNLPSLKLVEVLRQHLREKDDLMLRMKEDYQQRIDKYNAKIEELQRQNALQ
jgi:uncharacterized protein YeeX (DUF496 family)